MRIRSIKPEFWRSQDVAKLPRDVRLLFIGLWSYVDDNGVGIDDHRQIAADLFALEDDPIAAREFVREALAALSRDPREASGSNSPQGQEAGRPLIVRYEHAGKRYLWITGWHHQRIDKPGKPRYPLPTDCQASPLTSNSGDPSEASRHSREASESPRDNLAPGTGEQGNRGTEEQRNRGTDSSSPSTRADAHGSRLPDDFTVTDAMRDWARHHAPTCGTNDHAAFIDYWRSVPGQKGRKADWVATWRNWMRREHERRASSSSRTPRTSSTTDQRVAAALDAGSRVQALLDQQQPPPSPLEIES